MMSESMWIRSHVEVLLQQLWSVCRVEVDGDGDFPFRFGTSRGWVTVTGTDPGLVEVFAHATIGVRRTAKLLSELNEVQGRSSTARVQLIDDTVVVMQAISPIGLTLPVLAQAFGEVARVADGIGPLFAAMFDGATPHPVTVPEDEQAAGPP